jgi:DNA-3-methyladenine glycosylase
MKSWQPIRRDFFERDPATCARELIGARLLWSGAGGVIVETEAYAEFGDEACHTYLRRGTRAFVEEKPPGALYIYLNYGVHWLLNLLVKGGAENGFVLIRALEPDAGIEQMQIRRGTGRDTLLCSGPGKLTQALGIDRLYHGSDLLSLGCAELSLPGTPVSVVTDTRIGITRSADRPWRFLQADSRYVSVPPKKTRPSKILRRV